MHKKEFINLVAQNSGLSKAESLRLVDAVLDTIYSTLASGEDLKLVGFGNFEINERKAHMGRNPQTGEAVQIDASKGVRFRACKLLKGAINK